MIIDFKYKLELKLILTTLKFLEDDEGFSLIELVVVVAVLAILSAITIPSFSCFPDRSRATAALTSLRQIKTECLAKSYSNPTKTFTPISLDSYTIISDGESSCSGDNSTGEITAIPSNNNLLPTFRLNIKEDTLVYNFKGKVGTNFPECFSMICGNLNLASRIENYNSNEFVIKNAILNNECSDYVIVNGKTWEEAENMSSMLGGNLVTLNNKKEYSWLQNNLWKDNKLLKEVGVDSDESTYFFVGLNDTEEEGKYVWSSGEKSDFENNEDLIHRQNWIAQQDMANAHDYFVIGGTNDYGFTDYKQESYRPDLYNGQGVGTLTWVDNNSSWNKQGSRPAPHYGIAEIPICKK